MRLLKIGHDASCDIVLHSDKVSALHAEITMLNNGDILLEDKNSRNGTFVMNKPIKPGTSVSIRRGDAVRFADVELLWNQLPQPEDNSQYKAMYGIGSNFRNEVQVSGATVSRYHATLKIGKDGKDYIQDHSKNGTTVNGQKLSFGQTVRIKRSDAITCGGVTVDVKRFIPASMLPKILVAVGTTAVLVLAVFLGKDLFNTDRPSDYIQSTVYVHGYYHYTIRLTDDPFVKAFHDYNAVISKALKSYQDISSYEYPASYPFGKIDDDTWGIITKTNNVNTIGYSGTAFFVSRDGKMLTNRHVACPWSSLEPEDKDVFSQYMSEYRESILPINQFRTTEDLSNLTASVYEGNILPLIIYVLWKECDVDLNTLNAWIKRYKNSPVEITGQHDYIAIAYANHNYNSEDEFERCTVVAETEDDKVDLAVLQLNSKLTPAFVEKVIDVTKAVVDVKKLKPLEETYYYIGYPLGLGLNLDNSNGGLQPRLNEVKLSKNTGKYEIDLQGEVFGGASGSPILNKHGQLIGVVNKSIRYTDMSRGVLAKYAKELLDRTE